MIKLGITGGIGSGKTTVCNIFEHLGIPVYNSDTKAKTIVEDETILIDAIKKEFGNKSYNENGKLNRQYISEIVFKDKIALNRLNALIHPAVIRDFNLWIRNYSDKPYVIKESALLFETGTYKNMDKIISVYAPLKIRIERIMKRNDFDRKKIEEIIKNQLPEEEKITRSDYIIYNDLHHSIIEQVIAIHRLFTF
jgi:dephospho-CoA kinase